MSASVVRSTPCRYTSSDAAATRRSRLPTGAELVTQLTLAVSPGGEGGGRPQGFLEGLEEEDGVAAVDEAVVVGEADVGDRACGDRAVGVEHQLRLRPGQG